MKRARFLPAARTLCGLSLILMLPATLPAPAGAFIYFFWKSPVSGSADDPTKWNPAGTPGYLDTGFFDVSGTYTVTFPATVPITNSLSCGGGNVTFSLSSPHTTYILEVGAGSGAPQLTVNTGTMNVTCLNLGYPGSLTTMTLTNGGLFLPPAQFHSKSMGNPYFSGSGGDVIGYGGISELDVFGGAQYYCERTDVASWPFEMAPLASSATTLRVAGADVGPARLPSGLHVTGSELGEGMIIGGAGAANLFAYNGGYLDIAGTTVLGQDAGSGGWVTIGPSTGISRNSSMNVHNHLWIGFNFYDTVVAGHGELTVRDRAAVRVGGRCDVGDPDNDASSVLRITQGGLFRVNGGIKIWPTAGPGLDLRGGLLHVRGGAFLWPAGKYLPINSQVGTPELAISDGVTSTGPNTLNGNAQLFVGRGGSGTLHLSQPGTVFAMGPGSTTLGDSLGGFGKILVDSMATFSSGGGMNLAVRGGGELDVLRGSFADMGALSLGAGATGVGNVLVRGAGSLLQCRDNFWLGGGLTAGGTGSVVADSSATINVLHVTGINPAFTTIYSPGGSLTLASGGRLTTTGTVLNAGAVNIQGGEIDALNMPISGSLAGWGRLVTMLQNTGRIDPYSASGPGGALHVPGNYTQYAQGHYASDLGTLGGAHCDSLVVNGPATLTGTLDLRLEAGFVHSPTDTFTVLSCTSRTGTFSAVTWNGSPLGSQASVIYTPRRVRVVVNAATGVDPGADTAASTQLRFAPAGGLSTLAFALDLPEAATVQVKLYDVAGRETATLYNGTLGAGRHRLELQGHGAGHLSSGAYYARAVIESGGRTTVRSARAVFVH